MKHQTTNTTKYNRYPAIFQAVKDCYPNPDKVLSFGCSFGLEAFTLKEKYFPDSEVVGVDFPKVISQIKDKKGCEFFYKLPTYKFDIIFAMSVFCRWEDTQKYWRCDDIYPFEKFEKGVNKLNNRLNPGGILVIYNANFRFKDTNIYDQFEVIKDDRIQESGFVHKFNRENIKIRNTYKEVIFKKK